MGYGIYYRRPLTKMPTIPEHEEVYAVNDVWDNEFRMLEKMSCVDEADMAELGLYDLVWDQDFGRLTPCSGDEEDDMDFDVVPSHIDNNDDDEASRSLRAILDSFDHAGTFQHLSSDDEDYYEEDLMHVHVSSTSTIVTSCHDRAEQEYEEHKVVHQCHTGESSCGSEQHRLCCCATVTADESSDHEITPVMDVMRRSISAGSNSKQKVC
eukprot:TRINITY_DN1643_c0_g1_i1.p1 TRINITY_DN1643_c0_g1~~TRINITY_DN1643_c0_g1_i1.p1  ORF type:complete len:210 (-),score=52.16 TRINITY_DN1643_c0_g1_i1:125-754(-)